ISSVGRAIPCQGIGHRFEPDMSLQSSFVTASHLKLFTTLDPLTPYIEQWLCLVIMSVTGIYFELDFSLQRFTYGLPYP
ncbi:hypothetical protein, partial [Shewanella colwelliana]|uniref:hypothetical protein n=1 Tax=Shewanella colwelliana TaxID=23 RepID=UPI003735EA4B